MAAWLESERVQMRRWLGFGAIYLQADPILENAMSSVLSSADPGGTRPDSSTQTAIQGWLAQLANLEAQRTTVQGFSWLGRADEATIDPVRGIVALKSEMRTYVGYIADALATRPKRDVLSAPTYDPDFRMVPPGW